MSFIETMQLLIIFGIGLAAGRYVTLIQSTHLKDTSKQIREKREKEKQILETFKKH